MHPTNSETRAICVIYHVTGLVITAVAVVVLEAWEVAISIHVE
jgi:hypothetical protein